MKKIVGSQFAVTISDLLGIDKTEDRVHLVNAGVYLDEKSLCHFDDKIRNCIAWPESLKKIKGTQWTKVNVGWSSLLYKLTVPLMNGCGIIRRKGREISHLKICPVHLDSSVFEILDVFPNMWTQMRYTYRSSGGTTTVVGRVSCKNGVMVVMKISNIISSGNCSSWGWNWSRSSSFVNTSRRENKRDPTNYGFFNTKSS